MVRLLIVIGVVVAACTVAVSAAIAGEAAKESPPFSLSAAALYAAASAPKVDDGADVSVLEVRESNRFAADGSSIYTRHTIYKVLSTAGANDWNELSVHWSPWRDQKPLLKARVIAADGKEYPLDLATVTDSPAHQSNGSLYGDERLLRVPLPAIAPGAVVETEVVLNEAAALAGAGDVGRSYFQMGQPVQHFQLVLQAPKSIQVRYRIDLLPNVQAVRSEDGGIEQWVFDSGPMLAYEDGQAGLPSDVYSFPMVTFSTGSSWQTLAQVYSRIVDERIGRSDMHDLVGRLMKDRTTRDAKIAAAVEFLNREIRYTGIEFDQASILPHVPAETLSHRFGDCKDKATLLVSMLRTAGIAANVALLNAGDRLDVAADLPGIGLFDHAIVYIPGDPAVWVDPTSEYARFGQLPDTDRDRLALIVDPASTALSKVPGIKSTDNVDYEERTIYLADIGPARVVEISKPRGNYELVYRELYSDLTNKKTKDDLADYFKSEYRAERLDKSARSDPKDFAQPFQLTLEGGKADRGYTNLDSAAAYIPISGLFSQLPEELKTREPTDEENAKTTRPKKKRTEDYQISRPYVVERHYTIVPPSGFEPAALPPDQDIQLGPARVTEHFSAGPNGAVQGLMRFDSGKKRFTAAEQSELRNRAAALIDGDAIKVKFDLTAQVLLTKGRARESFQAFRDLTAQHPKDAVSHLRRANALLGAGMGEAARVEARLATQLDPHSATAQETLAIILKHDLIGREYQAGADFAGAALAYRAAIALDPADKSLVADYAVLLEHDDIGRRYGQRADLKGAIAAYRQLTVSEQAEWGIASNLPFALFYSRQFDEAKKAAETIKSPPLALLTACEAALHGVPQAIEEARRRTNTESSLKDALSVAGRMLMNLRDYANAAPLIEAGATGAGTAKSLGLASLLRRTTRYEDTQFKDLPEDFVKRVTIEMIRPNFTIESLRKIQSASNLEADRDLTSVERDQLLNTSRQLAAYAIRSGLSPEALVDIGIQSMQVKVNGNELTGYRAILQAPSQKSEELFVVKEQGVYKVLGSAREPAGIGIEVLSRLQHADAGRARALLDLLRESDTYKASDDPYEGHAFARFWQPGNADSLPDHISLAAASLLVESPHTAQRGIVLLSDAKNRAVPDGDRESIDVALLKGFNVLHDYAGQLAAATALSKRTPASKTAFIARTESLRALGRYSEAGAIARERLQTAPNDVAALRSLASDLGAQGDYAGAYEQGLKIVANSISEAGDFNELAWLTLFWSRSAGPDVESATRAMQLAENDAAYLHTLGCVYAELGKTKEARDVLLQAMETRHLIQPDENYWYAFGRIAEQYGESDIALADYRKVSVPVDKSKIWYSTYQLAQNRIALLKTPSAAAGKTTH